MKTVNGEKLTCESAGKICYTKREAGLLINGCKKHIYLGNRQWGKTCRGKSKNIPRRKYFCRACGFFHVTHLALYDFDSQNGVWEEIFYRKYQKKTDNKIEA